jgi:hypothetical protein
MIGLTGKERNVLALYNSEDWKDLKQGFVYTVSNIDMSQSSTSIELVDHTYRYNSIHFTFYENGEELYIYRDKDFNPYMTKVTERKEVI